MTPCCPQAHPTHLPLTLSTPTLHKRQRRQMHPYTCLPHGWVTTPTFWCPHMMGASYHHPQLKSLSSCTLARSKRWCSSKHHSSRDHSTTQAHMRHCYSRTLAHNKHSYSSKRSRSYRTSTPRSPLNTTQKTAPKRRAGPLVSSCLGNTGLQNLLCQWTGRA